MDAIEKAIDALEYGLRNLQPFCSAKKIEFAIQALREYQANQTGAEDIEIGDIVQFFAASHPLNEPVEYIGRVERDYKGLHAANRYLPITGVRIIEKGTIK